ncbi:MAG: cyclase family protein [Bryobacteraceae bacterium]
MPNDDRWFDVSVPLTTGMAHWPGDPEPTFERISEIEQGTGANVTLCRMTAHTGTHMDAPLHFLPGQKGIDAFPLGVGIGAARVLSIPASVPVVTRAELEHRDIQAGDRILLKTRNSLRRWERDDFHEDYAGINASAARFLADAGIALIGVDYLSVGVFEGDGRDTHRILLSSGVWIVEGLELSEVPEGDYDLICLPLRIQGCDGSPARVVLRPR